MDWSTLRRVPANRDQVGRYLLEDGDILFNNTSSEELVGRAAVFRDRREPVTFSNHFTRLRVVREHADPRFIAGWIHFQWQHNRLRSIANRWVNQAAIRTDALLGLSLSLDFGRVSRPKASALFEYNAPAT